MSGRSTSSSALRAYSMLGIGAMSSWSSIGMLTTAEPGAGHLLHVEAGRRKGLLRNFVQGLPEPIPARRQQ